MGPSSAGDLIGIFIPNRSTYTAQIAHVCTMGCLRTAVIFNCLHFVSSRLPSFPSRFFRTASMRKRQLVTKLVTHFKQWASALEPNRQLPAADSDDGKMADKRKR